MSQFSQFLTTSSIHGLRHLVNNGANRKLFRFCWFLILGSAFVSCVLLITKSIGEGKEHPVATTVTVQPTSSLPMPALTFKPLKEYRIESLGNRRNYWPILERVLNFFTFDCSSAGHFNKSESEAAKCLQKSKFARNFFSQFLQIYTDKTMNDLIKWMPKEYKDGRVKMATTILCKEEQSFQKLLDGLRRLLWLNDTKRAINEVEMIFKNYFLLPLDSTVPKIMEDLNKLNITWPPHSSCNDAIAKADAKLVNVLVVFALAFGHPRYVLPFGTLMKNLDFTGKVDIFKNGFENVLKKRLNIKEYNLNDFLLQEQRGSRLIGSQKYSQLLNLATLHFGELTTQGKDLYHGLAWDLAIELNIPPEVALMTAEEEIHIPPMLYHCEYQREMIDGCIKTNVGYTSTGLGYIMNQIPWKDNYLVEEPMINSLKDETKAQGKLFMTNLVLYLQIHSKQGLVNIFCDLFLIIKNQFILSLSH